MKLYQIIFHKTAFYWSARFQLDNGECFTTKIEDHAAHQIIKYAESQDVLQIEDAGAYLSYDISF